jgi:hypothetical protein
MVGTKVRTAPYFIARNRSVKLFAVRRQSFQSFVLFRL